MEVIRLKPNHQLFDYYKLEIHSFSHSVTPVSGYSLYILYFQLLVSERCWSSCKAILDAAVCATVKSVTIHL